jgi:protein SCO1/2
MGETAVGETIWNAWRACVAAIALAGCQLLFATLDGVKAQDVAAAIGSRFILNTHDGRTVTDQEFRGKHLLVFFGYTNCPDICPTGLQTLAVVMDELGGLADKVQPLFISVDPERDTRQVLASYISSFHGRIIGLTGPREMIDRIVKGYRVKAERIASSAPGEYSIDHTASVFHMGPDGRYLGRFPHASTPQEIAATLRKALAE